MGSAGMSDFEYRVAYEAGNGNVVAFSGTSTVVREDAYRDLERMQAVHEDLSYLFVARRPKVTWERDPADDDEDPNHRNETADGETYGFVSCPCGWSRMRALFADLHVHQHEAHGD
jgi:hypothetical protein